MTKNQTITYGIIGAVFIIISGTLLHFIFGWLGHWKPAALFAAVNESVWEHLKLAFWPAFLFALFQYLFLKQRDCSFVIAKTAGLYLMPAVIIILFYTYTGILGYNLLPVDISLFIVAVIAGQYISYRIISAGYDNKIVCIFSLSALIIITAAFVLLTYFPPQLPLFKDSVTGGYGIY